MRNDIVKIIEESIVIKQQILKDETILLNIEFIANVLFYAFAHQKKVLFCGNGGSAADAQHLAAEFSNKFRKDRNPLDAEALHVNTSYLTAVANDYSFKEVYSKLIKAKGKEGDILIAISTSGNSANIVEAAIAAQEQQMTVIGWTGKKVSKIDKYCNYLIKIPSDDTARIQECHILIGHIICQLVEDKLF